MIGLMVGNVGLWSAKTFEWRRVTQDLRNLTPHMFTYSHANTSPGGGPQIGEVTCRGLSRKRNQIKMRGYVKRRVTHHSGFPHLPGVPHLHVNRPLDFSFFVPNILAD